MITPFEFKYSPDTGLIRDSIYQHRMAYLVFEQDNNAPVSLDTNTDTCSVEGILSRIGVGKITCICRIIADSLPLGLQDCP